MKNVCFLFGAGTSCPAIPNMTGLYAKVEKALKGNYMENVSARLPRLVTTSWKRFSLCYTQVELTIKVW